MSSMSVETSASEPPAEHKLAMVHDSDSGHERTSSSCASSDGDFIEDQDDSFEDAAEQLDQPGEYVANEKPSADGERASLKVRLEEVRQIMRLALSNQFNKALDLCEDRAKTELYKGLAHSTLSFLRSALTLEQTDLRVALASINQTAAMSQSKRRQVSTASMVMRFLYRPNYDDYTDEEIHAELVNAESMLQLTLISFMADQSVLCLVRGALRIRACYQRYKECAYILENRNSWSCDEARTHFESGVCMGRGIFNLLMSYLPRRVLKILEYVGFSGSRTVGVDQLERSIELNDGLRSVFSALVLLTQHSYTENIFGLGNYDMLKVEQLNSTFLGHYPDSAFFLLFLGRYHQMKGHLDEAIQSYEKCCEVQQDWRQFHSLCHWEIMWCYACQMDWKQAAHYADLLRKHSKWSPSSYTYQYGTFLYAQLMHELRQGLVNEQSDEFIKRMANIHSIIETVPSLRIRFAGKTIPADKFAIVRAEKFCKPNSRLSLPSLEFLYIWNIFTLLRNNQSQVERLMGCIESEIGFVNKSIADEKEKEDSSSNKDSSKESTVPWIDNLCLMYLLKGVCLKLLERYEEAGQTFERIIEHEQAIVTDTFLVPHAAMELALLKLQLKQYEEARQWIKRARHNYTGYLMETIVHFRLHAASRIIRLEQRQLALEDSFEDQSPCPSPKLDNIKRAATGLQQ